jgi:hypothetical protein
MKVMVLIKVAGADEDRVAPTQAAMEAMGAYNEKLVKAGIMLEGGGLKPSSAGAQVVFEKGTTSVVDGPFTESKEILVGYWVWQVSSLEEAVEWVKKCPSDPDSDWREVLEVRPYWEEADLENLPA